MSEVATLNKLVVISEGTLRTMAASQQFINAFPFIRSLAPTGKKRCGSCGGGGQAATARGETVQAALRTIAGMADEKKRTLKRMLNAHQVRIVYRDGTGRTIQLTF